MSRFKGDRIAAYARYSSDKQSDDSIEDQRRKIEAHLARDGRTLRENLFLADRALSATSADRPQYERLMRMVRAKEIDVLIVESTSRLSRNNADSWNAWDDFEYFGVQLIAIDDGIDSSVRGSKTNFGFKALMNAEFIDGLARMTLRGMEGRAHANLSTGGLPFGYRSSAVLGPDGKPAHFTIQIDPERAKVVVGIFLDYLNGRSLNGIAAALNRNGTPSPRANSRHARKGGWAGSSIRAILHNEKYAGVWKFNERQWVKMPGTKKRVPRAKDASEIIRRERPDLRIIDENVWERVQQRLRDVRAVYTQTLDGKPKGRTAPGKVNAHVLSGLLHCSCGAPMNVSAGSSANYYRCADNKRGQCPNAKTLREDLAVRRIMETLHDQLASPTHLTYIRKRIAERLGEMVREQGAELKEHRARLARTEAKLARLVEFIAEGHASATVADTIRDLEAQAKSDRKLIAACAQQAAEPVRLPSPDEVAARVLDLQRMIKVDAVAGRELLRRLFKDSKIELHVGGDGVYFARSEILPLVLMLEAETPPSEVPRAALSSNGSGGRI